MAVNKALLNAKNILKKKWGDEVFVNSAPKDYKVISTGSMLLDLSTGIGGIPEGRLIEIYGPNSSGKTSIATSICVQAQKAYPDKVVAYVDIEQAFSPKYAESFGLDLSEDKFLFAQPNSAEEACEIVEHLAASGACSVIVYDSIGGSLTQSQIEKGVDEATMGSLAKIMSVGSNKIKGACAATGTICIFLNQVYQNIGSYGGGEKTKGGNSVPFFASIRLRVVRRELIADPVTKEIIGQDIDIKFIKNKVGTPYKELTTKLIFGKGFDFISELVDLCVSQNLISKGGAWYSFETYKLQGKNRVVEVFQNDPELLEKYKKLSTDKLLSKTIVPEETIQTELLDEDGYN